MSYIEIIDGYISQILNMKKLECMEEERAEKVIDDNSKAIENVKTNIWTGIDVLFNDRTIPNAPENINFMTINGYADSSKKFDEYNIETGKTEERLEFFYTRGHFYDAVPKLQEGKYVVTGVYEIKTKADKMVEICQKYQALFKKMPPPIEPPTDEDGNVVPLQTIFWNQYLSAFQREMGEQGSLMKSTENFFAQFFDQVNQYKKVFYEISMKMSIADLFVSSAENEALPGEIYLDEIHARIDSPTFSVYSADLGTLYDVYKRCLQIRKDTEKDDDYNVLIRKIFTSELCKAFNFYNESRAFLEYITSFRKTLNV